ncbi:hypothetical protein BCR44DRAFT_1450491 [Catenaria anguillulae PL171]|uniref:Uncharacterized protein n=1 Tax=Catenaria anguillulae PL171 TaxID=765915 RepID=A0A1Y2H637_9FUNG|nr:hypothetical protein BCR44DRAFT_1450491 [Catenaria anguillulae PL171]
MLVSAQRRLRAIYIKEVAWFADDEGCLVMAVGAGCIVLYGSLTKREGRRYWWPSLGICLSMFV